MADYNIYIHSTSTVGQNDNPTRAWSNQIVQTPTAAWKESDMSGQGLNDPLSNVAPFIANESMEALKYGGSTLSTIAVAAAIIKTGWEALKLHDSFASANKGDFRLTLSMRNFETMVNSVFRPVSTTIGYLRSEFEINRENQRRTMQLELLGDSDINRYTNRGY